MFERCIFFTVSRNNMLLGALFRFEFYYFVIFDALTEIFRRKVSTVRIFKD